MEQGDENEIHEIPSASFTTTFLQLSEQDWLMHLSQLLTQITLTNDPLPITTAPITRFHSRTPPTIPIRDYLARIIRYTAMEPGCLLLLLIYIDRICQRLPHFAVTSLTLHRFVLTSLVVASKALQDAYCTNTHYARVGGISVQELNALEVELVVWLDWRTNGTKVEMEKYFWHLIKER